MKKLILLLFCSSILLSSCWDWARRPHQPEKKVWGYKQVFTTDPDWLKIQSEGSRTMKNPGKIYVKDNLIFQNDIGYGIHVIDNSNPSQAKTIGFIKINGSSEISIKGNYLYTNSYTSLVVADVSDWQNVKEIKRIPNAFQQGQNATTNYGMYFIPPPEHGVYYDCYGSVNSPGKIQTGWVRDSIYNYCFYQ